MIYAYSLPDGGPDTLNPATVEPDYLTQTGADGTYRLTNIKYGRYRVMAVRDVFKNLLYNVQTDMFAMPVRDIQLVPAARDFTGLIFKLTTEDTLRPYLTAARAVNGERVIIRFNEKPSRQGLRDGVSVLDTISGSALAVLDFSPADTVGRAFHLETAPQDSDAVYRLTLSSLSDLAGNNADSSGRTIIFTGAGGRDTVAPVVVFNITGDSTTGILPHGGLTMSFSRAVDTAALMAGFSLTRGSGVGVPGMFAWEGSMIARFDPDTLLVPGGWYEFSLAAGSLRDVRGSFVMDSMISKQYRITEGKFLGSIAGRISPPEGRDTLQDGASVIVISRSLSGSGGSIVKGRAVGDGRFLLEEIPAGRYVISAFLDGNGNGRFDYGSPYPLRYAEQFFVYPDTMKIRPGWPVSGVRVELGQ